MDDSFDFGQLNTSYHLTLGLLDGKQIRARERPAARARLQRIYTDLLAGEEIYLGNFDDTRKRANLGAILKGADHDDLRFSDSPDDYLLHVLVMRRDEDYTEDALVFPPVDALVTSIDTLVNGQLNDHSERLYVVPTPKSVQLLDMYVTHMAGLYGMDVLDAKVPADLEDDF